MSPEEDKADAARTFHEAHAAVRRGAARTEKDKRFFAATWLAVGVLWYLTYLVSLDKPWWWATPVLMLGPLYVAENWRWVSGSEKRGIDAYCDRMEELWEKDYGPPPS